MRPIAMIILMEMSGVIEPAGRRAWRKAVPTVVCWVALVGLYYLVLPLFGVVSIVTWILTCLGWLGALLGSAYGAIRLARSRMPVSAAVFVLCWAVTLTALSLVGLPVRTVDDLYQQHRGDLD